MMGDILMVVSLSMMMFGHTKDHDINDIIIEMDRRTIMIMRGYFDQQTGDNSLIFGGFYGNKHNSEYGN